MPVPIIIEPDVWQAAQAQAKANRVKPKNKVKHEYLMNTRMTCPVRILDCSHNYFQKKRAHSFILPVQHRP